MFARDARYPSSPFVCKYNTLTVRHTQRLRTHLKARKLLNVRVRDEKPRVLFLFVLLFRALFIEQTSSSTREELCFFFFFFPGSSGSSGEKSICIRYEKKDDGDCRRRRKTTRRRPRYSLRKMPLAPSLVSTFRANPSPSDANRPRRRPIRARRGRRRRRRRLVALDHPERFNRDGDVTRESGRDVSRATSRERDFIDGG